MIFMGFDYLKIDDKGRVKLKVYPFKCYNKPSIKKKTRKQLIAERIAPSFLYWYEYENASVTLGYSQ